MKFSSSVVLLALIASATSVFGASPNTAYVDGQSLTPQNYDFSVRWTGYTDGELHLGTCSYDLVGVPADGENTATKSVTETELLNTCGFTRTVGESDITIEGSVLFYSQASNDNQLLYQADAIITYPLVVEANTQASIQVLSSSDVGVDAIIPSELSLCGETTLSEDDPRLTTTVGSSLCFRHTLTSTSSGQLALDSLEVRLAGNPITVSTSQVVDNIGSNSYVEYWILLESGPCSHCQYTSTMELESSSTSRAAQRLSKIAVATGSKTTARATSFVSVTEEHSESGVLSEKESSAILISILIIVGLIFLLLLVGVIYHHRRPVVVV